MVTNSNIENIKSQFENKVNRSGWEATAKEFSATLRASVMEVINARGDSNRLATNINNLYALVSIGILLCRDERKAKRDGNAGRIYFLEFMDTGAEYLNLVNLGLSDYESFSTIVNHTDNYAAKTGYYMAIRKLKVDIIGNPWYTTIPYTRAELEASENGRYLLQLFAEFNVVPCDDVKDYTVFKMKNLAVNVPNSTSTANLDMGNTCCGVNYSRYDTVSEALSRSIDDASKSLKKALKAIGKVRTTTAEKESIGFMGWIKKILKWLGIALVAAVGIIAGKMLFDKLFGNDEYVEYISTNGELSEAFSQPLITLDY